MCGGVKKTDKTIDDEWNEMKWTNERTDGRKEQQ